MVAGGLVGPVLRLFCDVLAMLSRFDQLGKSEECVGLGARSKK